MGLCYPPIFEDMSAGIASLQQVSKLQFNTAAFMHGKSLNGVASKRFLEVIWKFLLGRIGVD
jgi:hypothetical protein